MSKHESQANTENLAQVNASFASRRRAGGVANGGVAEGGHVWPPPTAGERPGVRALPHDAVGRREGPRRPRGLTRAGGPKRPPRHATPLRLRRTSSMAWAEVWVPFQSPRILRRGRWAPVFVKKTSPVSPGASPNAPGSSRTMRVSSSTRAFAAAPLGAMALLIPGPVLPPALRPSGCPPPGQPTTGALRDEPWWFRGAWRGCPAAGRRRPSPAGRRSCGRHPPPLGHDRRETLRPERAGVHQLPGVEHPCALEDPRRHAKG